MKKKKGIEIPFTSKHLSLLGAFFFIGISFFLYTSTEELKKTIDTNTINDVVRSDSVRMRLYEGSVSTEFEGEQRLAYSFRIPENAAVVTALQGKSLAVTQGATVVGRVGLSYEGGRGYTEEDYIREILLKKSKSSTKTYAQSVGGRVGVTLEDEGVQYFISSSLNKQWLIIFETDGKNESDFKQMVATFEEKI